MRVHTLNLGVFLKVLQVRGQFLYFINLSDFEAVRVKGAFYSRMCFFCNVDTAPGQCIL